MITISFIIQRAFALDSRTVWVEQQHVHSVCMPKENLPLGPGEYNPKQFDRNICTPFVGKRELFPSDYKPFMSSVWSAELGGDHVGRRGKRGEVSPERHPLGGSRSDFASVFHDNDKRQPLDPSLRFCETPGPTLGHDPVLETVKYDGRYKAPSIYLDKNTSARFKEIEPMKEYDPHHNSTHLVKRTKEQFVPKIGHINPFPPFDDGYQPHQSKGGPMAPEEKKDNEHKKWKPACNWTTKNKHGMKFDASCYAKKEVPDIIRPSEINRRVKKDQFFRMLTTPVQYDSKSIGTAVDTRRFRGDI